VKVTGRSNRRVSLAAIIAIKPGQHPRLIYRVHKSRRRGTASARVHRDRLRPGPRRAATVTTTRRTGTYCDNPDNSIPVAKMLGRDQESQRPASPL